MVLFGNVEMLNSFVDICEKVSNVGGSGEEFGCGNPRCPIVGDLHVDPLGYRPKGLAVAFTATCCNILQHTATYCNMLAVCHETLAVCIYIYVCTYIYTHIYISEIPYLRLQSRKKKTKN